MKKDAIKKALDKATQAAIPAAIKDEAKWRARSAVAAAAAPPPGDDDSGEYPAVSPSQTIGQNARAVADTKPSMVNGIRVNYAGPSRKK